MSEKKKNILIISLIIILLLAVLAIAIFFLNKKDNENDDGGRNNQGNTITGQQQTVVEKVNYDQELYECDLTDVPKPFVNKVLTEDMVFYSLQKTGEEKNYFPECANSYFSKYSEKDLIQFIYSVSNKSIIETDFSFYDVAKYKDYMVFTNTGEVFITDLKLNKVKDILAGSESIDPFFSPEIITGEKFIYILFRFGGSDNYDVFYDVSECFEDKSCNVSEVSNFSGKDYYSKIANENTKDFPVGTNAMDFYPRTSSVEYRAIDDKLFFFMTYYNDHVGIWDIKNDILDNYGTVEYTTYLMDYSFTTCNEDSCFVYYPLVGSLYEYSLTNHSLIKTETTKIDMSFEDFGKVYDVLRYRTDRMLYFEDGTLYFDILSTRYKLED